MEIFHEDTLKYLNSIDSEKYKTKSNDLYYQLYSFTQKISQRCIFNPVYVQRKLQISYKIINKAYTKKSNLTDFEYIMFESLFSSNLSRGYFVGMERGYPVLNCYTSVAMNKLNGYGSNIWSYIDSKTGLCTNGIQENWLQCYDIQVMQGFIPIFWLCCDESLMDHIITKDDYRSGENLNPQTLEELSTPMYIEVMEEWNTIKNTIDEISVERTNILNQIKNKYVQLEYNKAYVTNSVGLSTNKAESQLDIVYNTEHTQLKYRNKSGD